MDPETPTNKGLRFFAATVLVVPTYFTIRGLFSVPRFEMIFMEMLGDKPLPALTQLLISAHPFSLVVPLGLFGSAVFILIQSKKRELPYYVAGSALICLIAICLLTFSGLWAPMLQIITEMNSQF